MYIIDPGKVGIYVCGFFGFSLWGFWKHWIQPSSYYLFYFLCKKSMLEFSFCIFSLSFKLKLSNTLIILVWRQLILIIVAFIGRTEFLTLPRLWRIYFIAGGRFQCIFIFFSVWKLSALPVSRKRKDSTLKLQTCTLIL